MVVAEPVHLDRTPGQALSIGELGRLGLDPLLQWLGISEKRPLQLRVYSSEQRRVLNGVVVTTLSHPLNGNALLELHTGSDKEQRVIIPESVRVFVDAPSLALIWACQNMTGRIRKNITDELEGTLRLIDLTNECCGLYARDPLKPRTDTCYYDKPNHGAPFTHLDQLRTDLAEMSAVHGLKQARVVAKYAIDNSWSSMETYINLALTLPPRLAGVSMQTPLMNRMLVVDDSLKSLIEHKSLRPDLQWPDFNTLVEFLGDKSHASKSSRVEDKNRLQDYVRAKYSPIFLMFDDVRNVTALNQSIITIARELMRHGKHNELYRVQRILKDQEFYARQQTLVKTLLPPVKHSE